MQEFITAIEADEADRKSEQTGEEQYTEFVVGRQKPNGDIERVTCRAYKPEPTQLAMLMAATGRGSDDGDAIAGVINFFLGLLDPASERYISKRLLDRRDPFGMEDLNRISDGLIEEWGGRPTKRSSGSTSSPPPTGSPSTEGILI